MPVQLAYSIAGAQEATGLGRTVLTDAIRSGELRARKSGRDANGEPVGKYVIRAEDLKAFIDGLPEA